MSPIDLGEKTIQAMTFNGSLPGPEIRVNVGDLVKVTQSNSLPAATSIHFHGLALRNDADGVPLVTQKPVAAGSSFTQSFKAPHPGTYWYHSHSGLQLESGLYGAFIIEDPNEAGAYDEEWVLLLDDWTLGIGASPEQILADLTAGGGSEHSMHGGSSSSESGMGSGMGMDMGMGHIMSDDVLGLGFGTGDVTYPTHLINGKGHGAPVVKTVQAGSRIRLRVINASSDTMFAFGIGGHKLTVTHTDGFAVRREIGDSVLLGMGERIDALITVKDGVWPVYAQSLSSRTGMGFAVLRGGSQGNSPTREAAPTIQEILNGRVIQPSQLQCADGLDLNSNPSARLEAMLMGQMNPYSWNINGLKDMTGTLFELREGETVDLTFMNHSMMSHPMHLHGHTFQVVEQNGRTISQGARKDTVMVRPMNSTRVRIKADNPGDWVVHCHNSYHMETGMMGVIRYKL